MSQGSKYEVTPQLASPRGKVRQASFFVPHTSHEASQAARIVNVASELSIAQTRLVAISALPIIYSGRYIELFDS